MICQDALRWAVNFIQNHSDGDLFPRICEIKAISDKIDDFVNLIAEKDLSQFNPGACRRFLVPKDEISYRQATQLDPQDSILLTAIIYQFGTGIEQRRLDDSTVFSYRFSPDPNYGLYSDKDSWNRFWIKAQEKSSQSEFVLYCDVADYYNQIYHHTLENQLLLSGFPNPETKWILNLIKSTTANVSRGVPVGPHPIHLLAEAAMIPIDNSINTQGFEFLRYVDDIIIFCRSKEEANRALARLAVILDRQQRLILQRHKTKIYNRAEFNRICSSMVEDRPICDEENKLLNLIKKYSGGNPYANITYNYISLEDWESISEDLIRKIVYEYINQDEVDYIRLRWFYRRLTQIGHPGAIEVSLNEMTKLSPCFANICTYLASVQSIDQQKWKYIGERILPLLEIQTVMDNEYFRLSLLSLFTRNKCINHFSQLANKYPLCESFAKREILLAACQNSAYDWIREQKENYQSMDPWQKMAFIYAFSGLPRDEKQSFLRSQSFERPFDVILSKWAKGV